AVLELARATPEPVDLVLLTGDLAAAEEADAYRWLVDELRAFNAPVWYVPGNHDHPDTLSGIVDPAGWHGCGSRRLGGWDFILLNSAVAGEEYGALGAVELAALADYLGQSPALPTLLVLHHHPVPLDSRWMDTMTLRNATAFWALVERYAHVRGVLWGHVHQNYDSFRGAVRLLATPSTCVQFAARSADFALDRLGPGFRRLQLHPDGAITTEVVRL
ncbi:MAG: metallophosphoesterase, partial [Gammaproteobacteria bacterium]